MPKIKPFLGLSPQQRTPPTHAKDLGLSRKLPFFSKISWTNNIHNYDLFFVWTLIDLFWVGLGGILILVNVFSSGHNLEDLSVACFNKCRPSVSAYPSRQKMQTPWITNLNLSVTGGQRKSRLISEKYFTLSNIREI